MFIAVRELRRAKVRFALLGGAVGLLVFLLLFFQAVAGTLTGALTGAVANTSGEVVVYSDRARANPNASVVDPATVEEVAAVEGVAAAAGVGLTVVAATADGGEEEEVSLIGVEPDGPGVPTDVLDGRLAEADGEAASSGSGFSPAFAVGDRVTVGDVELEVVGEVGDAASNALPTLYTTTATLGEVVRAQVGSDEDPPLSLVAVAAEDGVEAAALAERITDAVDGVEALARPAAVDAVPGVETIGQSFGILTVLLFVVVTITTAVFFLILTVQKRDALVLLRAVGARRRDVVLPVLQQVVLVVGVGALVGAAMAAGLLALTRDTFGASLEPSTVAATSAAILVLGLLAAGGAVERVLAIDPLEATTTSGLDV